MCLRRPNKQPAACCAADRPQSRKATSLRPRAKRAVRGASTHKGAPPGRRRRVPSAVLLVRHPSSACAAARTPDLTPAIHSQSTTRGHGAHTTHNTEHRTADAVLFASMPGVNGGAARLSATFFRKSQGGEADKRGVHVMRAFSRWQRTGCRTPSGGQRASGRSAARFSANARKKGSCLGSFGAEKGATGGPSVARQRQLCFSGPIPSGQRPAGCFGPSQPLQ